MNCSNGTADSPAVPLPFREEAVVDGTSCGGGPGNVIQNVVIVDAGNPGRRDARLTAILTLSQTGPVAPGTRLTSLTAAGANCLVDGIEYNKFSGTVE